MSVMFDQLTGAIDDRHRQFFAKAGDARQVWALDRDSSRIVYLPEDGVYEQLRDACDSGRLCCPMADCPDPRFVAKGGELRRHHFAHKVAHTRHVPAAVFRAEAVAMLADWARHRYRGAEVATSDAGALGAVAIRSKRTGKVVTLGVTYDRGYPYWQDHDTRRHDQLLVGHTRGLLLPRAEHPRKAGVWCCGAAQLVQTIIARHDVAVAVNPQQRLVATIMSAEDARGSGLVATAVVEHPTVCVVDELDACRLDETGVVTPALGAYRAWQRRNSMRRRPPPRTAVVRASGRPRRTPQYDEVRRQEYRRRSQGLRVEQRLALMREIFLGDKP